MLQRPWRAKLARARWPARRAELEAARLEHRATMIEAGERGRAARKLAGEVSGRVRPAAARIQSRWRGQQDRRRLAQEATGQPAAARRIQSVARGRMARHRYPSAAASPYTPVGFRVVVDERRPAGSPPTTVFYADSYVARPRLPPAARCAAIPRASGLGVLGRPRVHPARSARR